MNAEKWIAKIEADPDEYGPAARALTALSGSRGYEPEFSDGRKLTDADLSAAAQRGDAARSARNAEAEAAKHLVKK